jgi:hypothetical protein
MWYLVNGSSSLRLGTVADYIPEIEIPDLPFRVKIYERYGRDGGDVMGDRQIGSRNFNLILNIGATSDVEYFAQTDALYAMLATQDPDKLYLLDDSRGFRLWIVPNRIGVKLAAKGNLRRGEVWTIPCYAPDGAWESSSEIESTESGGQIVANGETITVQNDGPLVAWPIITMTCTAAMPEFQLVNGANDGVFRLGSSLFVPGVELRIDSREGVMEINDGLAVTEVSASLADGTGLLRFAPGQNVLTFTSLYGAAGITIQHRIRRPF